jgi:hypothetical protein
MLTDTPEQKKPTTKKDIVTSGGQPETYIKPLPIEVLSGFTRKTTETDIYM